MGRANRALAGRVSAIAGGFLDANSGTHAEKIVVTGNPVRPAVLEAAGTPYQPSLAGQAFRLLVFGGSQGAQFFSDAVPAAIATLPEAQRARLQVTQQARADDVARRQGRLCQARHAGRGPAVLYRHGRPDRRRASGDFALRRFDGFGNRGDRPAGPAGSLSLRARPRPGGECRSTCCRRRRRSACPVDALDRTSGSADRRCNRATPRDWQRWRRQPNRRGNPMRRGCSPIWQRLLPPVNRLRTTREDSTHENAGDHRPGAFHRHRRHRHERHRRGAAQSRLQGAGFRSGRKRQCAAAARQGHRVLHRAPRGKSRRRRSGRRLDGDQEIKSGTQGGAR